MSLLLSNPTSTIAFYLARLLLLYLLPAFCFFDLAEGKEDVSPPRAWQFHSPSGKVSGEFLRYPFAYHSRFSYMAPFIPLFAQRAFWLHLLFPSTSHHVSSILSDSYTFNFEQTAFDRHLEKPSLFNPLIRCSPTEIWCNRGQLGS